jgi:hypothetical protein
VDSRIHSLFIVKTVPELLTLYIYGLNCYACGNQNLNIVLFYGRGLEALDGIFVVKILAFVGNFLRIWSVFG